MTLQTFNPTDMSQGKFPRYCSLTKQGMWAGWCVNDGDMYIKHEFDAVIQAMKAGYANLQDAFDDDYMYYTEWSEQDIED